MIYEGGAFYTRVLVDAQGLRGITRTLVKLRRLHRVCFGFAAQMETSPRLGNKYHFDSGGEGVINRAINLGHQESELGRRHVDAVYCLPLFWPLFRRSIAAMVHWYKHLSRVRRT